MDFLAEDGVTAPPFSYPTLENLVEACVHFYHKSLEKQDSPLVLKQRKWLAEHVRKFHGECGTLTPRVEEAIENLANGSCLLVMTAHQPNLFAYGGVLRKATLSCILTEKLRESLRLPVVSFFGVADQDFTDDRWVRSAVLPDVEKRGGLFELSFDVPEKLMLNRVPKPSKQVLDDWRIEIKNWIERKLLRIERSCKSLGLQFDDEGAGLAGNFEDFWRLVKDAYEKAETYSDFNAFTMSRIVNEAWGYDTLFARFSECQQVLGQEFCLLLSNFDDYSLYVKEATMFPEGSEGGVYEQEFETVPFWYHCDCGSKARLKAEQTGKSFFGRGQCVRCGKEYRLDFGSKRDANVSEFLSKISARSLPMPLVFFHGLNVGCYVGGVGGTAYLKQTRFVAKHLNMTFPPVIIWRPRDAYFGVGQLDAIMTLRKLSGTADLTKLAKIEADIRRKIADVQSKVDQFESEKERFSSSGHRKTEQQIEDLKVLSARQNKVRKEADFSLLVQNLGLLEKAAAVMDLYPCIVDYAVNVGLEETSQQWITFLQKNGSLCSNVKLRTAFDDIAKHV